MPVHRAPQVTRLLDLLEILPLNEVEATTWAPLNSKDQGSFKLVCRQSRHLADQLTTSTHHDLLPNTLDNGSDDDQAAARGETLWRQAAASHAAFLTRLPRLTSLTLSQWPSEAALASELLVCGTATHGRLTQLALEGGPLSTDGLRAARLACPQLRQLKLQDFTRPLSEGSVHFRTTHLDLCGPLFLPLHGAPWLTQLTISTNEFVPPESLRSLAGLATLRSLDLSLFGASFEPRCLLLLTGLHGLERCLVEVSDTQSTLPDFAALLAATRLTRLHLYGNWVGHLSREDEYPPAAHAAALALLGDLSHLQALCFGEEFIVDGATFDAIRRLTQLTELGVGQIQPLLAATRPAHFPHLQELHLMDYDWASPPRTLHSLLPLLPLPSLADLSGEAVFTVDICGDDDEDGEVDAAGWAATLHAVLQGLASCPLLRHEQGVGFVNRSGSSAPRSLTQLAEHLLPTAPGLLPCVSLLGMVLEGAPWGRLHACWPGLRQLDLSDCDLSTLGLAALVEGMVTLQHLSVHDCEGPGEGGWAVVAAHCCRPLQVTVRPAGVPLGELVRCRAVQQAMYGVQNIEWLV